jgi:hypothetical protein
MAVNLKLGTDSVEPSKPRELFPLPAVDTGYSPGKRSWEFSKRRVHVARAGGRPSTEGAPVE